MLLRAEAAGLLVLAVALAGPVPAALARARWPARDPRAALVLWQAVGLGGGLSILGAGVTLVASSLQPHWLPAVAEVPAGWSRLGTVGWAGAACTAMVGAYLVAVAAASTVRVVSARRTHRQRLDLVADRVGGPLGLGDVAAGQPSAATGGPHGAGRHRHEPSDIRLVDHPAAVAYCLPGIRPRVVVSAGAVDALDRDELAAVLAHERAHARGRHDLVVQPFVAWQQTFPFLPAAGAALTSVELLVEMLADDAARRSCKRGHLQRALQQLAARQAEWSGGGEDRLCRQVPARAARMATTPVPLGTARRALVYLAALALVVVPPLVLSLS